MPVDCVGNLLKNVGWTRPSVRLQLQKTRTRESKLPFSTRG
jgi:hypothetical protein